MWKSKESKDSNAGSHLRQVESSSAFYTICKGIVICDYSKLLYKFPFTVHAVVKKKFQQDTVLYIFVLYLQN